MQTFFHMKQQESNPMFKWIFFVISNFAKIEKIPFGLATNLSVWKTDGRNFISFG